MADINNQISLGIGSPSSIKYFITFGLGIGVVSNPWTKQTDSSTTWSEQTDNTTIWTKQANGINAWTAQ